MNGMHRTTGAALSGHPHIAQSVADILTTPLGSRVMRRDYGSLVPDLIDQPLLGATLLRVYAAVAMAIARWEPRIRIERLQAQAPEGTAPGRLTLRLDITVLESGERSNIEIAL